MITESVGVGGGGLGGSKIDLLEVCSGIFCSELALKIEVEGGGRRTDFGRWVLPLPFLSLTVSVFVSDIVTFAEVDVVLAEVVIVTLFDLTGCTMVRLATGLVPVL